MRSFGRGLEFDRAADSHPLLWSAFTLLAFDELERHINLQQLTTFADDYLASWDISSALQLNNACVQAGKLIDTLTDLGMQIADRHQEQEEQSIARSHETRRAANTDLPGAHLLRQKNWIWPLG